MTKQGKNTLNVVVSLVLGGAILYWMYRGFDFGRVREVLLHEMSWTWMLLSFPFGVLAQAFRGWRWRQTLEPILRRNEGTEVRGSENTSSAEHSSYPQPQERLTPAPRSPENLKPQRGF